MARLQGVGAPEWTKYAMGDESEHAMKNFIGNAFLRRVFSLGVSFPWLPFIPN